MTSSKLIALQKAGNNADADETYTPYYAVAPLLKYIPKDKTIWCPFDEQWSAFYNTFKENGYKVLKSSLNDGKDFFTYEPDKYDVIVSNPPYSIKDKVLNRCMVLDKPFCLLVPLTTLQGIRRYKQVFSKLKNIQLLIFDKRVSYHMKGNINDFDGGNWFASIYIFGNCKLLPSDITFEELEVFKRELK